MVYRSSNVITDSTNVELIMPLGVPVTTAELWRSVERRMEVRARDSWQLAWLQELLLRCAKRDWRTRQQRAGKQKRACDFGPYRSRATNAETAKAEA
jgi:hypothetical protein